jgi:hypothetical protein
MEAEEIISWKLRKESSRSREKNLSEAEERIFRKLR